MIPLLCCICHVNVHGMISILDQLVCHFVGCFTGVSTGALVWALVGVLVACFLSGFTGVFVGWFMGGFTGVLEGGFTGDLKGVGGLLLDPTGGWTGYVGIQLPSAYTIFTMYFFLKQRFDQVCPSITRCLWPQVCKYGTGLIQAPLWLSPFMYRYVSNSS